MYLNGYFAIKWSLLIGEDGVKERGYTLTLCCQWNICILSLFHICVTWLGYCSGVFSFFGLWAKIGLTFA